MEACQSSPNFLLVRYEDLVSKQESEVGRLFEFSNLQISKQTLRFLESSKNSASRNPYSVFGGGSTIPMKISGVVRQKISEEVEANGLGRSQFLNQAAAERSHQIFCVLPLSQS